MFYITEKLKGTPEIVGGLMFGRDDVYEYYVHGMKTPVCTTDYYFKRTTDDWKSGYQKYTVDDFIKQFKAISERKNFTLLSKTF